MSEADYIAGLAEMELEEKRRERRAVARYKCGLPLSYDDLEILTGVARSTLSNWKATGKIEALPDAMGSSPKFACSEVRRILGAGKRRAASDNGVSCGYDESEEARRSTLADPVRLHGPADRQTANHQKEATRHDRRGPSGAGPTEGPSSSRAHEQKESDQQDAEALSGLLQ